MRIRSIAWLLLTAGCAAACSPRRMALSQAIDMSIRALPVYDRETDVEFGGQAVAGHIKLLEGLLESAPDDPELLLALARSYSRYAFGYVQLKIDCAGYLKDQGAQARWTAQAADFYGRARAYGTRLLTLNRPSLKDVLAKDPGLLASELRAIGVKEAPALFWTAFAWGNELACQPVTTQTLADLQKTVRMMHRVIELDERIVCGSAHVYLGFYYSRLPQMLGGDASRAEAHFIRATAMDCGSYLPARLLQAEYAWRVTSDTSTYTRALRDIVEATSASVPEHQLDNAVARRKARIRLAGMDSSLACDCAVPRMEPTASSGTLAQ